MLKLIRLLLPISILICVGCTTKSKSSRVYSYEEYEKKQREEKISKCGEVDVIMQDNSPRLKSEIVDIYFDENDVPYETITIASLTTEGGGGSKESELLERISCVAKELGANGIIWQSERYDKGILPVAGILLKLNRLVIRAKAVAYIARK